MIEIFEIAANVFKYGLGITIGLFSVVSVWLLAMGIVSGITKSITGE